MRVLLSDIHFEILGITRQSTKDEIKKAYREQIKKWHPDKFPNQPEKIAEALEKSKRIIEAYSLLENYRAFTDKNYQSNKSTSYQSSKSTYDKVSRKTGRSRLSIERIKVKSSNVSSIGYDQALKVLQIEFINGNVYQYYDVPENIHNELMYSSSKGKYLNGKIASVYQYECV